MICQPSAVAAPARFILIPIRVFAAACLLAGLLFATRIHAQQQLMAKSAVPAATASGHPAALDKITAISTADALNAAGEVVSNPAPSSIFSFYPATVKDKAKITVEAERDEWATLRILDKSNEIVLEQQMAVSKGINKVPVFFISELEKGRYTALLTLEDKLYFAPMVKE